MATLRCKVRVHQVTHNIDSKGNVESEDVKLMAVYEPNGGVNAEWTKWTPSADFELQITNPKAIGVLTKDHEFYVDFIKVDKT